MGKKVQDRFTDPGDTIYQLMSNEILVECPKCSSCAAHRPIEPAGQTGDWFAPRRLVCTHCALTKEWRENGISRHWYRLPALDDYFGLPLWIRGRFRKWELWAYSWRHLDLIENYVRATLRQRDPIRGKQPQSFLNRLPRWIKSSKNRDHVLATIREIRKARG